MPRTTPWTRSSGVGISMKKVTDDLVTQAVKLFAEPFDKTAERRGREVQVRIASRGGRADLHAARRRRGRVAGSY